MLLARAIKREKEQQVADLGFSQEEGKETTKEELKKQMKRNGWL